ncbi:MAG TPA: hypothetical protein VGL42_01625 [Opitutaceae bacterium]|jgi:hypothetical protein
MEFEPTSSEAAVAGGADPGSSAFDAAIAGVSAPGYRESNSD